MTPLEVNLHTVPHLKALSSGIEAFRSHGSGRPFLDTTTIWKVPILYHTETNSRFVLLLIVYSISIQCCVGPKQLCVLALLGCTHTVGTSYHQKIRNVFFKRYWYLSVEIDKKATDAWENSSLRLKRYEFRQKPNFQIISSGYEKLASL